MFYQFTKNALVPADPKSLQDGLLTVSYVTVAELEALHGQFGFDVSTVEACKNASHAFRSGVEVQGDYTYTQLRIFNTHEQADDFIALYLKENLVMVVDIEDRDSSTKEKFEAAIHRYPPDKACSEKIISAFLTSLLVGDLMVLEELENALTAQESELLEEDLDKDFNRKLLGIKKILSKRYTYYAQLLDITDAICENDNEIFADSNLIYIDNVSKKLARLKEETATLRSTVEHLQDAYAAYFDNKLNSTMKVFTVLTSIFFPLTIIVGWYGMNFEHMPEFAWRYGYLYVILLSIVTVLILVLIGKRKKWF